MANSDYYEEMKALARRTREQYGLTTPRVQKSDMRRIYKDQGIRIDLWDGRFKKVRGAYFDDADGPAVMIVKGLPADPTVFTMGHELKHHLVDRHLRVACCEATPGNRLIEVGAEVFAAELIFPECDFAARLDAMGVRKPNCRPEDLVQLKVETRTTLSYAGLAKRCEFLGYGPRGAFAKVRWKNLEESLYGEPVYKRLLRARGLF
jgi:Zn-dependent peptidase ImmA (M78 family)